MILSSTAVLKITDQPRLEVPVKTYFSVNGIFLDVKNLATSSKPRLTAFTIGNNRTTWLYVLPEKSVLFWKKYDNVNPIVSSSIRYLPSGSV